MKRYLLALSLFALAFSSCKKDSFDAAKQAAADDAAIQTYLAANTSITATKDPSGLYYQVVTAGTGTVTPTLNSTLTVNYTGKLLNGNTFDSGAGVSFPLSNVIQGWQIGIPKITQGGRILLIIPSALAYGNSSPSASIPNNSVLVFTIDLTGLK